MDGRMLKVLWGLCLATALLPAQAQEVYYIHTDALGSPVAETDANRNVVARVEYEPYGRRLNGSNDDKPGYAGHVVDAVTGLVQMQQRYYDPGIGVFLSVDPVTAFSNPVGQFHRYRYANNNPYAFVDPDGRESKDKDRRSICNNRKCDAVVDVNPSSGSRIATTEQRVAIGSMTYRSARTGSEGVESKFYMNDSGDVLGRSQEGCFGEDRCIITRSELPDGTTLAGHLHVYPMMPGGRNAPEALKLSREFPGPGDHRPLKLGLVSAVIMPSGARYLIEGSAASPTISYLGGGDAVFGAYVTRTWQPEMSDQQIRDAVRSYLSAPTP